MREGWTPNSPLSKYIYLYDIKDHLGNVRLVHDDSEQAKIYQGNYYSAFGVSILSLGDNMTPTQTVLSNDRLYNGKELQDGTNWLDYGARMYYPELGRWMAVDPLPDTGGQESWSTYQYVFNNPAKLTDPDGRLPDVDWNAAGKGFVKGVVGAAVGAVVVGAVVATAGAAAPLITAGLVAYGAYETGKTSYEIYSGKEAYTGRALSTSERSEKGGALVGGIVGGGLQAKSTSAASNRIPNLKVNGGAGKEVSPNVKKVLEFMEDFKSSGRKIEPIKLKGENVNQQEFHIRLIDTDNSLMKIRVETHRVPIHLGGNGKTPQRHMNVEVFNPSGNQVKMKHIKGGHIILE